MCKRNLEMIWVLCLVFLLIILLSSGFTNVQSLLPFDTAMFPNIPSGQYRAVVLKTIENGETYYVGREGNISYFKSSIPYHRFWYDEEDVVVVPKSEIYKYPFNSVIPEIKPAGLKNPRRCPCGDKSIKPLHDIEQVKYCFVESAESKEVVHILRKGRSKVNFTMVSHSLWQKNYLNHTTYSEQLRACDILIQFTADANFQKHICPEDCKPVKYTVIATKHIHHLANNQVEESNNDAVPVTCSMTWSEVRRLSKGLLNGTAIDAVVMAAEFLLEVSYKRRLMECNEQALWPKTLARSQLFTSAVQYNFEKRKVHGLIVTAGGIYRYGLVRDQYAILLHQHFKPGISENEIIAGWGGTEDQYPCVKNQKYKCYQEYNNSRHVLYMPDTSLNHPGHDSYNCAQRRPMRALSHAMLLYDPNFIIVGDDDTFISRTILFSNDFQQFVRGHLMVHNEVYSELYLSDRSVTREGFFYGGAGYLFGKVVIDKLNSNIIPGPTQPSYSWSGTNMTRELSLLFEAAGLSTTECPSCMSMPDEYVKAKKEGKYRMNMTGTLHGGVRLVDMCTNLMSGPNTCYNSDHALSRCFAHGLYTRLLNAPCLRAIKYGASKFPLSMCYSYTSCNTTRSLTCHRYRVNVTNPDQGYSIRKQSLVTFQ